MHEWIIGVTESCIKRNVKSFINRLQHNHDNKKERSKKLQRHKMGSF